MRPLYVNLGFICLKQHLIFEVHSHLIVYSLGTRNLCRSQACFKPLQVYFNVYTHTVCFFKLSHIHFMHTEGFSSAGTG